MKRLLGLVCVAFAVVAPGVAARADEASDALDKGIKALGGEEKYSKAAGFTSKTKAILTIQGNDNELTGRTTSVGLSRFRSEAEGEFNGQAFKVMTVIDGDKGWRKFGDNIMPLEGDQLANEKRVLYLQAAPSLVPLKGKEFKVEKAGEEKVGDKPATVLKVTGPDGKDFKLFLDKETGLPAKLTATVPGFMGDEVEQETLFKNYKDFDGIKKPTKVEIKRDGQTFLTQDLVEFKVLDKAPSDDTFAEPK